MRWWLGGLTIVASPGPHPLSLPGWTHLCKTPQQHLGGRLGPIEEYLRHQCDGHLQDTQQADREVKAGGTYLELSAVHKVPLQAFGSLLDLSHQEAGGQRLVAWPHCTSCLILCNTPVHQVPPQPTSWIMPMNSEKAQLSWLRTLLRKLGATSEPWRSRSAICCCSRVEGQGSAKRTGRWHRGLQSVALPV